jgi:hypothetical protein
MVSLKKERSCGFLGSYLNFMQFLWEPWLYMSANVWVLENCSYKKLKNRTDKNGRSLGSIF